MVEINVIIPNNVEYIIKKLAENRAENRFKNPDAFVVDFSKKISTECQKAVKKSKVKVNVINVALASLPMPKQVACYWFEKSDEEKIALALDFKVLFFTLRHKKLFDLETAILHELYHHKDRWFLGYKRAVLDKVGDIYNFNDEGYLTSVNVVPFWIEYLMNVRAEGFATFYSRRRKIDKPTLERYTNNVIGFFNELKNRKVINYIDLSRLFDKYPEFSSSLQGEAVFFVIYEAKGDQEKFIRELDIQCFFDVFYDSLKVLGLEEKYSIIPKHLAKEYLSHLSIRQKQQRHTNRHLFYQP